MKRRFPDLSDIEAFEKTLTKSIDPKAFDVTMKPKDLADELSQDIKYNEKLAKIAHEKEAFLEDQIVDSVLSGNEEQAQKLSKAQNLYNMSPEERTEKLRQNILDALTPDMEQDIKWMRTYKNEDVSAPITNKELEYLMSGDYRKIYEDRAAENNKESDYPDFIQLFKDFHDESEADPTK